jgi:hypothetical protein
MNKILNLIISIIAIFIPARLFVSLQYYFIYSKTIDYSSPKLLSEKLQILKIGKQSNNKIICSDKIKVKDYIRSRGYEHLLIPTLDIQDRFHGLSWNEYPVPYIIKVSNGSGQQIVVMTKRVRFASKVLFMLRSFIKRYNRTKEMVYAYSKHRFIVEPYLMNANSIMNDYKFYCFNGEPKFIQINDNNSSKNGRMMIDENYNYYPFPFVSGTEEKIDLPSKSSLDKMKEIARDLSKEFDFVRVDLYLLNDEIKFGELTFYPLGGYMLRNSYPLDQEWGKLLNF